MPETLETELEDAWSGYRRSLARRSRSQQTVGIYRKAFDNFWRWATTEQLALRDWSSLRPPRVRESVGSGCADLSHQSDVTSSARGTTTRQLGHCGIRRCAPIT